MRPEERAILWLLDPQKTRRREQDLVQILRNNFPWFRFCRVATAAGIGPFLYLQIRRHELGDLLPRWAYEQLHSQYDWAAAHNAILLRDLRSLTDDFTRQGIGWSAQGETYLLLHGLFPDRALYKAGPITLGVPPSVNGHAVRRLSVLGYRATADGGGTLWTNERGTLVRLEARDGADQKPRPSALSAAASKELAAGKLAAFLELWVIANHAGKPAPSLSAASVRLAARLPSLQGRSWVRMLQEALGRVFPGRTEMLRRHGKRAVGMGLYALYASRLLALRARKRHGSTQVKPGA